MEIQTEQSFKEALLLLEKGEPEKAQAIISTLFEQDLDSKELSSTNRYCMYWIDTLKRLKAMDDPYERSDVLLLDWKNFLVFVQKDDSVYEPALFAIKKGFFTNALKYYISLFETKDSLQKAELFKKAGICYKKLGDFENALNCLKQANVIHPKLSSVLAELADCYSLCGEDKPSKVLFREAFFIAPEYIDLDFLDSELIKYLIKITTEKGYSGKALKYWIPVYGVLYGVFNIRRELSSQDVGKLKKDIYAMENEFKDPACNSELLIPKMLNYYFWLIDYYISTHESVSKINENLLKIKILDSNIYQAYIK